MTKRTPRATELVRNAESGASFSAGNVILATPPAGFARRRHEHRHAYLSLTLSGGWREAYRGRVREFGPGSYAVHAPEAAHARLDTAPGTRELYLEVEPDELPERWSEGMASPGWSVASPLMHALFASIVNGRDCRLHIEALVAELLAALFGEGSRSASPSSGWMRRVRDAIEDERDRPPTLRALSRRIGMHPSHLARCFRAANGLSVGEYVQRLRIGRALDALQLSDRSLSSIAAENGFSDQSHFGRVFRRHIGVSPGAYRRLLRG